MSTILSAHGLSLVYKQQHGYQTVLEDVDLQLCRGSLVALLGRNGAGKSTLLKALSGAMKPIAGKIVVEPDTDLSSLSRHDFSKLIALVTTHRVQAGALTVHEVVSLGRQPYTGFLGRLDKHDREIVNQAIEQVGIEEFRHKQLAQLSDGERQKVMIARALAQSTPIIMLDEPTAFLDVASRIDVMRLLHNLAHDGNKAVLLSSHDVSQSLLLADELWLITGDKHITTGATEDVVMSGAMQHLFGSERGIEFNVSLCDYEASLPTSLNVSLCDTDGKPLYSTQPALQRSLQNAFLRNGIAVTADAKTSITVSSTHSFVHNNIHYNSVKQICSELLNKQ